MERLFVKSAPFYTSKLNVRGLNYHIQQWGDKSKPTLLLLHGWMDCGASFQFIAPYLIEHFHIIAPDLRGFGNTDHAQGYWFPDYFADVDVIVEHFFTGSKAYIAGHSMGGNIAMLYAGIQHQKVAKVLSLEGVGMMDSSSQDAPKKYRKWMSEILSGEPSKVYPSQSDLMDSIRAMNPSLNESMIETLTEFWGHKKQDGTWALKHDHNHRYTNPVRYLYSDAKSIWQEITAQVGLLIAQDSWLIKRYQSVDSLASRIDDIQSICKIDNQHIYRVSQSDHMMHLEQPRQTAKCMLDFFKDGC